MAALLRAFTVPAIWIAPPNSSSFSVSVVLPASGCEIDAKVRRALDLAHIALGCCRSGCLSIVTCEFAHGCLSAVKNKCPNGSGICY